MTQGRNRYPNIKVAAYTLLCKYIPEHIDNKNKSTTMHGRPATGVSFYRRGTPNDEPPVAGTNDVTEYMITCWKCRRRGHRYPLCPKSDDTFFQGMQLMFTQVMYPPFSWQFTHPSCILVDTGSTFNSICNNQLLKRVSTCSTMQSLSNWVTLEYTQCGSLDLIPGL